MKQDIEKALSFDSIAEAERVTGKSYKEDSSVVWLGMALGRHQAQERGALLHLSDDTNSWSQSARKWFECVERMGFVPIYEEPIPDTPDKIRIFWRDGVLLFSETYEERSINSAKAYFNYKGPRDAMFKCSNGFACEDEDGSEIWEGSYDARDGLKFALNKMSEAGQILPEWRKAPFLWLLSYMDAKQLGYDYKAITASRVTKLPAHVQKAIQP